MGKDPVNSNQVKKCINDWIASGPNAVQSLTLGGTTLTVNYIRDTGSCAACMPLCITTFARVINFTSCL